MRIRRLLTSLLTSATVATGLTGTAVLAAGPADAATQYCADIMPVAQRPTLHYGDTGWCVQQLQVRLNRHGAHLRIDHDFGSLTLAAVKSFQRTAKLPVTGVVDQPTWLALVGATLAVPPYTSPEQYIVYRGPNHTPHIVLTFDDCPSSRSVFTAAVNAAHDLGITVVLAPTGQCQAGPNFNAAYARSHGQIVIGHTISHPNLLKLTDAQVKAQADSASLAAHYLRPPYGEWDARVAADMATRGIRLWAWTRDTGDWSGRSQADIVQDVVTNAQPNDTFLMHMQWHAFNPVALTAIKTGLAKRGLGLCTAYATTTAPTALPAQLPC